jgi:cytochrome c oxidase subunit 2
LFVPPFMNVCRIARIGSTACALAPSLAHAAGAAAAPAGPLPLAYVAHAARPAARPVLVLGWALLALCTLVCVTIAVLLALAIFRRRRRGRPRSG